MSTMPPCKQRHIVRLNSRKQVTCNDIPFTGILTCKNCKAKKEAASKLVNTRKKEGKEEGKKDGVTPSASAGQGKIVCARSLKV